MISASRVKLDFSQHSKILCKKRQGGWTKH